ncbi:MAG: hypothetical protein OXI76_16575 [Gemmatimonadota bacterium]|nr:hypothetical protein [Gemmatimonadota bacterium]
MMPIPSRSTKRREALYALAMAENMPDAGVLDDIVRQYPQFSRELTEFAVELALDSLVEDGADEAAADPTKVSPAVSRAMSAFHNRLYALRQAGGMAVAEPTPSYDFVENPFSDLGLREFRAVANGIGANTVLVAKLRDRQIDPTTISDGFKRRVSKELEVPVEVLTAHLEAGATETPGSRQFYKADRRPRQGERQSFADAVRGSGLTDEQQRHLLSL